MAIDLEEILTDALAKIRSTKERDSLEERFDALEQRKPEFRISDIVTALENASDEELEALENTMLGDLVRQAQEVQPEAEVVAEAETEPATEEAEKKMRPGRKNGSAYNWWVDDDGNVTQLDVARVYSGPDEPDEVELPDEVVEVEEVEEAEAA